METGKPSQTAESVANHRAAHRLFDSPLVLDDPLALEIIGRDAESDLRANREREMNPRTSRLRAFLVVRSRFSEDAARASFARGVLQYVVLGSGLDTSSLRLACAFPGIRAIELDHPATQKWKRARLAAAGIPIPQAVRLETVDFQHESLAEALARAGFDFTMPAQFAWLGVVPYLTEDAIDATLEFVVAGAAGSEVVFDYAERFRDEQDRAAFAALADRVAKVGEPFRTLLDPKCLSADLKRWGYSVVKNFTMPDLNQVYFNGRTDGLSLPGRGRIMQARV